MRIFMPAILLAVLLAAPPLACAGGVADTAKEAVGDVKDKASDVVDDATKKVEDEKDKLVDMPLMPHAWAIPVVVLVSLFLGFLLGKRSAAKQKKKKDK